MDVVEGLHSRPPSMWMSVATGHVVAVTAV
ncbi:hypothetical protein BKA23_1123 [Rudaeicoccus suwonensis]|uniref:Uncharacterized protein n=1 Tax=Rudaeicoccus suwonensis TaxID=657409 RepID=A0A561E9N6_9MICO|nr:hypothetical protein BKA23_1123 [Rudaeicoccus suwonensis]